jgi:hypothetical protein
MVCETPVSFFMSVNELSGHKREINVFETSFHHTIFSFCSKGKATKKPSFKVKRKM